MSFGVGAAPPSQAGGVRMTECCEKGSTSEEEGEGKKVKNHSQPTAGARASRVGKGAHGKTVQSIKAAGSLL